MSSTAGNPCDVDPCYNSGTCLQVLGQDETQCSSFLCQCPECFEGPTCLAGKILDLYILQGWVNMLHHFAFIKQKIIWSFVKWQH